MELQVGRRDERLAAVTTAADLVRLRRKERRPLQRNTIFKETALDLGRIITTEVLGRETGSAAGRPVDTIVAAELECPICQAVFTQQSSATRHVKRAHGNDKPHGCKDCDKHFATTYQPREHERIVHSDDNNDKPYECFCGKKFTTKSHLTTHARTHKLYQCLKFRRRFSNASALQKHALGCHFHWRV